MKVFYKIVRVYADVNNCPKDCGLTELEKLLNEGYMIERVEELHSYNYRDGKEFPVVLPYTIKDYILFKFDEK